MSTEIAELLEIKNQVIASEKLMEELLIAISKGDSIKGPRPSDFCARRVPVTFYFDTLNLEGMLERVQRLSDIAVRFYSLREKQSEVEKRIQINQAIQSSMKRNILGVG